MTTLRLLAILVFAFCMTAFAKDTLELKNAKGESVGHAIIYNGRHGLRIQYDLKNLPPGEHAMHLHQNPVCEADSAKPDDAFKSAGPHFNPEGKKHGTQNPDGPHAGDLPNFTVGANGKAKGTVDAPNALLFGGKNGIRENNGAALVIHAKADDLKTDPAGNSGPRIACGVMMKPQD
jgi:Cu-Zn family superoxide dismutase